MSEIYISIDIETTGPIPGPYSMISLGAAAFNQTELIDTFSINLEMLPNSTYDPDTLDWWRKNQIAFKKALKDPVDPKLAMEKFSVWCNTHKKPFVAVCYPAGFDWTFIYWYLMFFTGKSPMGMSCLDIKTYAMSKLNLSFKKTTKKTMPKEWFNPDVSHTHVAVEDAIEQGYLFINMLK